MFTNEDRAGFAAESLESHSRATNCSSEPTDDQLADMLANLMHYARAEKVSFEDALFRARCNFHAEKEEG